MAKEKKQPAGTKRKKLTIMNTLLLMAMVPTFLSAIVLTFFGVWEIQRLLGEKVKHELLVAAENVGTHYRPEMLQSADYQPEYDHSYVDSLLGYDIQLTLFIGNTRYVTSIEDASNPSGRNEGTTCDDKVWSSVSAGNTYSAQGITINGKGYFVAYVPIKDDSGTVIGMGFAGIPENFVRDEVGSIIFKMIMVSVILLVGCSVLIVVIALRIKQPLEVIAENLELLANGHLKVSKTAKSQIYEIDSIIRSRVKLTDALQDIISKIREVSDDLVIRGSELESAAVNTSVNADDIAHAVEDISKGSVSMATDIDSASASVSDMGERIEGIVSGITDLDSVAGSMNVAGQKAMRIIRELDESNERTAEAIRIVAENVEATDRSVSQITQAVGLITEIADQTNLLSLNASIEAARAGEVGRGFAVVANEISGLAAQSNDSAKRIEDILGELVADSRRSMEKMSEVSKLLKEQQENLKNTEKEFENVTNGINDTKQQSNSVDGQAKECNMARVKVIDIITSLSSISEENAASTEETTASMQELNATINLVAKQAEDVKGQAEVLEEVMKFFQL